MIKISARMLSILMLGSWSATTGIASEASESEPYGAYLFVHYTAESQMGEQVYFAVSTDGLNWTDLNNSKPVLVSDIGEKGVRDPTIIRTEDGRFYILATDLSIASGKGWEAAMSEGSTSLLFWESEDLVNWSSPWMIDIAGSIPEAGCAWAPEAIYDDETGDYIVYWATISPMHGVREARIFYSRTKDFRTFSPPELYIERDGEGVYEKDIIDTQIVKVEDGKYKYYRASRDSQITIEGANSILGDWDRIGDISHLGYSAAKMEGPILYRLNGTDQWALLVEQYAAGKGYLPLLSNDLSDCGNFRVLESSEYSFGRSRKRHGDVMNITRTEYDALLARWSSDEP